MNYLYVSRLVLECQFVCKGADVVLLSAVDFHCTQELDDIKHHDQSSLLNFYCMLALVFLKITLFLYLYF